MEEPEPFVLLPFHGVHQRAVSAVTFAPTSSQLAASSFTSNHSSPTNQGRTLAASASADGTVRTWEITGDMLDAAPKYSSTQQEETSSGLLSLSSPDVQIVDSTPDDVTNRNESKPTADAPSPPTTPHTNKHTKNSQPLTPLSTLIGHSRGINDVTFNRTSHYLATASDDKTLRLWDVTHQHSCKHSQPLVEFRSHTNFAFSVRFNPQSNLLVSGSFDETVKLWDVRSGECVSTIPAHSDPVTGVDFSRDGSCIVSGSHDGLIRIWDVATSECLKTIYADGNSPVGHVGFSPNGKYVLAGTLDSRLRLWHVGTKAGYDEKHGVQAPDFDSSPGLRGKCSKTYSGHLNTKHCLFASFAGMHGLISRHSILTGSEDGRVHVYGLQSRKVRQVLCGHVDAVLAVAAHNSKDLLCSGGMTKDRTVRFWVPGKNEMAF